MNKMHFDKLQSADISVIQPEDISFLYAATSTNKQNSRTRKGSYYFQLKFSHYDSSDTDYTVMVRFVGQMTDFFVGIAFQTDDVALLETGDSMTAYLNGQPDKNKIYDEDRLNPLIMQQIRRIIVRFFNKGRGLWSYRKGYASKVYPQGTINISVTDYE